MSVISVREQWKGRGSSNEFGVSRDSSRVFKVWTDNNYDTDAIIESDARLPAPYSPHPNDFGKFAKKMRCEQDQKSPRLWIVTVEYATPDKPEENDEDDPLARRAKINISTTQRMRPMVLAYRKQEDGSFSDTRVPIKNSAEQLFQKVPDVPDSLYHATIEKNVPANIPSWFFDYKDAVNSDSFVLRGQNVAAGWALMLSIGIGDIQTENGVEFSTIRMEMEINPEGHDVDLVDTGFEELIRLADARRYRKILDGEGTPIKEPAFLNGEGKKLADDAEEVYITYRHAKRKSFGSLPLV